VVLDTWHDMDTISVALPPVGSSADTLLYALFSPRSLAFTSVYATLVAMVERDERFYMTLVTVQASTSSSVRGVLAQRGTIGGELSLQGASTTIGISVQDLSRYVFTPCNRNYRIRHRGVK